MNQPAHRSVSRAPHVQEVSTNRRAFRPRDPEVTSRIMAAVRSTDSECELVLRRELWRRGWRYRLHCSRVAGERLPGRPDLVFTRARVLVFVDGDFWHGRALISAGEETFAQMFRPAKRRWWVSKIGGNVARDRECTRTLRTAGWRVIRVWESDVLRAPEAVANRVESALERGHADP